MRRKLAALLLGAVVLAGTTACPASEPVSVEVEDCDAEDYRNKEAECGFTDADRKKTKAPAPKTTKRKP